MVYGSKANKPANSPDPKHKRRISLLNSDFKIITGIDNSRLKKVATHTLNANQLSVGDDRRIHHGICKARDAINVANNKNQGAGILDNDYMAAFDYMVLTWVFKGLDQQVISRLKNLYDNHLTVVVINNIQGRCFANKRWSIRQGDRPSSVLFCYGLDPHLDWLENRLRGIPIYQNLLTATASPEIYKLIAYVDDVKPSITSMNEFTIVDKGSELFEAASGCVLHRDPASGKVKFLPLGRWKGTLTREDLPVNYIVLSEHLDMVGVKLMSSSQKTRKLNCDELQTRVKDTTGAWKGGKFMPLTLRPHSINTYCLSKILYRCSSINLRVFDLTKISSHIKSWLYADQLEKPEELILFRSRKLGGLSIYNVKLRAMAELIKSFLETAVNPNFKTNLYHQALYQWHVEDDHSIPDPGRPPYYSEEFFSAIRTVRKEGLLNVKTLSLKCWYKVLLENFVTTEVDANGFRFDKRCRIESAYPYIDWERTWSHASLPGVE